MAVDDTDASTTELGSALASTLYAGSPLVKCLPDRLRLSLKLHLEEAEAPRTETVFAFPLLQREKLHKLLDELGVGEIFVDDLFTLSDTRRNAP